MNCVRDDHYLLTRFGEEKEGEVCCVLTGRSARYGRWTMQCSLWRLDWRQMDLLTSLDPTAVCITLLVVALTLLWLYVSMTGARREQPNLSALYEQTSLRPSSSTSGQSSRSPRAASAKGKGKSKQVRQSQTRRMHKLFFFGISTHCY